MIFVNSLAFMLHSVIVFKDCFIKKNFKMDFTLIDFCICLLSGIGCFWMFYKCIDWFEKI